MSWQDDINSYKLIPITTGDGETYNLKMKFKGGSFDPLTASYNYAGKVGTKPKRNSCASPVYDFLFYVYQDQWKSFIKSISDPSGEWLVKHPLYGDLKGQPTSLSWDNTYQGDVEFTVQFQESITDDTPTILIDYKSRILTKNVLINDITVTAFAPVVPSVEEIGVLTKFVDDLEEIYQGVLNSDYLNAFYDIRQVLTDAVFDALRFIDLVNTILNIGSVLSLDGILYPLKQRFDLMTQQNEVINNVDENTATLSPDGNSSTVIALFKELAGASNMGAIAVSVSTPSESQNDVSGFDVTDISDAANEPDYKYKKDVDSTIEQTNQLLNDYIETLDAIDIEGQGFIKYSPDDTLSTEANNIILLSIQEIKEVSSGAKEENIHLTRKDTVPEILAFELYGSASDENVNEIINNNDLFGKNSVKNSWRNLVIKKNTEIVYYA